jgi:hypothetical protein
LLVRLADVACFVALSAAHRFLAASAMARLPAALNLRFRRGDATGAAAVSERLPDNMALSVPICSSILLFCVSKPSMAAMMISFVNFCVGMLPPVIDSV